MAILRAIVHQQQNLGAGHTLTQHIEKPLRLAVDPVQVFKDQDQRLIETLAQEQLLERLKRPPPPNLRVHLLQRRGLFFDAQQGKQIGQGVFQTAVEHQHFAGDLLPSLAFVILGLNLKVALEQFNHRQIRRGFAVRDRVGFQHQTATL